MLSRLLTCHLYFASAVATAAWQCACSNSTKVELLEPYDAPPDRTPGGAGSPSVRSCGNQDIDTPEECDDGNAVSGDGCEPDCRSSFQTSGDVALVPAPAQLYDGLLPGDGRVQFFTEQLGVTLPGSIPFDVHVPHPPEHTNQAGQLTAGARISSYYFHFGARGNDTPERIAVAVTFATDVVAVISDPTRLDDTDPILGLERTDYPRFDERRGLETADDSVQISDDRRTVSLDLEVTSALDGVRVLTGASPADRLLVWGGRLQAIAPPVSLSSGAAEHELAQLFLETEIELRTELVADAASAKHYRDPSDYESITVATGTRVLSYLLSFDPPGTPLEAQRASGSVTFPGAILGVIARSSSLASSQALTRPTTLYPPATDDNGLELETDSFWIGNDRRSLTFRFEDRRLDQLRVVVAVAAAQ